MNRLLPTRWPSLTTQIVIGLLLGVGCGMFFGEYCESLHWIGEAFVGLLQMMVLPYIVASLISNVGKLSFDQSKRLARIGGGVLVVLWGIGLVTLFVTSFAFPAAESGSFFSVSLIQHPPNPDFVALFVPANPFSSLAHGIVPAVVVFSIGVGIALIGLPNKDVLLAQLDVFAEALLRLNQLVVRLAPIGTFAIVAHATGTLPFSQFGLLPGYVLSLTVVVLFVAITLPMLIAMTTPIGYWEAIKTFRIAVIAAFVLGSTFVVLPLIIDEARRTLRQHGLPKANRMGPDALVPLAFPFPDLGRIIRLLFVPFSAWFYGSSLSLTQFPLLLALGLVGCFAKLTVTIPWLLDVMHIPSDIFELYLAIGVYTSRLGDVLQTIHLATFALLATCAMSGVFKIQWKRVVLWNSAIAVMAFLSVGSVRAFFHYAFHGVHDRREVITRRDLYYPPVPAVLVDSAPSLPGAPRPNESWLDRIRRNGFLRVGFDADALPFSYFNEDHKLVGFDIDMANQLAHDLGVRIELIPLATGQIVEQLREGDFDIAIGALEGTVERASSLPLPDPYLDVTLALVTLDYRKRGLQSAGAIRKRRDVRIAVVKGDRFAERVRGVFPNARIVRIDSESIFFNKLSDSCDALVTSAEMGAAWTLLRPEFTVVTPLEKPIKVPLYYMVAPDTGFVDFLNTWLELKKKDGTIQRLYDYWILGKDKNEDLPRWCIIRDVLHWVP